MSPIYEQFHVNESRGLELSARLFLGLLRNAMCPNPNHPPHVKNPLAVIWLRENMSILCPSMPNSAEYHNEQQYLFYLLGLIVEETTMWGWYMEHIAPLSDEEAVYNLILDFKTVTAHANGAIDKN